jgi:branched-chain amino acid transport system permease protein
MIKIDKKKYTKYGLIMLAVLLIPIQPFVAVPNHIMTMLNLAGVMAIAAIGYNILLGVSGQISLGHGALIGVGAYISANLTLKLNVPFIAALIIAGFGAALVGIVVGFPAIRLGGHYLAIATLGFGVTLQQILVEWDWFTNGYSGLKPKHPEIFGYVFKTRISQYYLVLGVIIILMVLAKNILKTKTGRALTAMRDSSHAAQAMGINIAKYKLIAFGISAFYAGVAGSLYAHFIRFITPQPFDVLMSLNLLAMVVVGGLGSISGAIYGALFMNIMPELVKKVPVKNFSSIMTGVFLIIVVMFFPYGLARLVPEIKAKIQRFKALRLEKEKSKTAKTAKEGM